MCILFFLAFLIGGGSAEPSPPELTAVQKRAQIAPSEFVYNLAGSPADTGNGGGKLQRASVAQFPALAGQGIAFSLLSLEPCGVNLPHLHPRATELLYVISATKLRCSLVEENMPGGVPSRDVQNDLQTGQVTFFPQGLIHTQQNLGCDVATLIAAFNSEDPGVNTVSLRLFDFTDDELLATALNITISAVQTLRRGLPPSIAKGRAECLQMCGLPYSGWLSSSNSVPLRGNTLSTLNTLIP